MITKEMQDKCEELIAKHGTKDGLEIFKAMFPQGIKTVTTKAKEEKNVILVPLADIEAETLSLLQGQVDDKGQPLFRLEEYSTKDGDVITKVTAGFKQDALPVFASNGNVELVRMSSYISNKLARLEREAALLMAFQPLVEKWTAERIKQ